MKPICVPCKKFYRPHKNGVCFEEGMPTNDPREWKSYKLWLGDLWKCSSCGNEIISGVGFQPIAVHHEANYKERCRVENPTLRVDDC